eukprot:GHVS01005949.1.p2 GENE.GHVS01005949.1~~GHVS01005949.1.p2  ORF type:complete len:106 (+),score=5.27 GHVS01005949.1:756-1073(+)
MRVCMCRCAGEFHSDSLFSSADFSRLQVLGPSADFVVEGSLRQPLGVPDVVHVPLVVRAAIIAKGSIPPRGRKGILLGPRCPSSSLFAADADASGLRSFWVFSSF